MPDPLRKTVSASQVGAILDRSHFSSRWLVYQYFIGNDLPDSSDERTEAGQFLEPGILAWTAARLGLKVQPHRSQEYISGRGKYRHLGCTQDAETWHPERGLGVVECKNVDYRMWKERWTEDRAPDEIEIQLQVQMAVLGASWGVIAANVGGNSLTLYRRAFDEALALELDHHAEQFLADVASRVEPQVLGMPRELVALRHLYPEADPAKVASGDISVQEAAEDYLHWNTRRKEAERAEKSALVKLKAAATDASILELPDYHVYLGTSWVQPRVVKVNAELGKAISVALGLDPEGKAPMLAPLRDALTNGIEAAPGYHKAKPIKIVKR